MSLINCKECGKEISDQAISCPNCGAQVNVVSSSNNTNLNNLPEPKTNSTLGIIALILSILGCTYLFGLILALIDLFQKGNKKKTCSVIALFICGFWLLISLMMVMTSTTANVSNSNKGKVQEETITAEKETELQSEVQTESIQQTEIETSTNPEDETPSSASSSDITLGHKNALRKAGNYLDLTGFSYSGLIKQLEFEGFSSEEATYAADNCGADWNEQAAIKAQTYLDLTAFSRDGLIEQLKFEGFTSDQANYGATAVGY